MAEVLQRSSWGILENRHIQCSFECSHCALTLDGMAIRRLINWDPQIKQYGGFTDNGSGLVSDVEANEALSFLCVGLIESWKVPAGYILAKGKQNHVLNNHTNLMSL